MPDITMCKGDKCKKRDGCYRFLATPSHYQSFFVTAPIKEDESCEHYWPVHKNETEKPILDK